MISPSIKTFFSFIGLNNKALKNENIKNTFFALFLLVFSLNGQAQESSQTNNPRTGTFRKSFTRAKALLKEQREIIKSLRADFKASLSETQRAILKNDSMDKRQRRKRLY